MKILCRFLLLILAVHLTGCAYLGGPPVKYQNRETHYLSAKTIPPLRIPPGISSSKFESTYHVSEKDYPEKEKIVPLTPPGLYSDK